MKKVISTIAVPLSGNRGSSSMLMSIIENLSRENGDVRFNVLSYYPKVDRRKNRWDNVVIMSGTPVNILFKIVPVSVIYYVLSLMRVKMPRWMMCNEVKALLGSDLYVAVGGTTFNDAKILKVVFNVLCLLPAVCLRLKLVLYTQTIGPFDNKFNRIAAKWILPKARVVIGRGQQSHRNLADLGLSNIEWATDAAFALKGSNTYTKLTEKYRRMFEGRITVGISPNSIVESACKRDGIAHARIFADFIDSLIEDNYLPVLIPHSAKQRSKNRHNNDIPVIGDIIRHVRAKDRLIYIGEDYDYLELREIIGTLDYYVACRFHSMISALYMNVPVVVYGWGYHKYKEIMNEFGLGDDVVFNYTSISAEKMKESFQYVVNNRDLIRKKISNGLPSVVEKSNKANRILMEQL